MSGHHEQSEGGVASMVGGLVKSLLGRQETGSQKNGNTEEEAVEPESPLNVLNQAALRSGPDSSTPNTKSDKRWSGLGQSKTQTISTAAAVAASSPKQSGRTRSETNEKSKKDALLPTRTSPRGHKRARELDGIPEPRKSPRTRRSGNHGQTSIAVSKDRSRRTPQEITEQVPKPAAGKLRRPKAIRNVPRRSPTQQGEEVFEVGPSPKRHRAIPPAVASPQKGQRKTKHNNHKAKAREQEPATEGGLPERSEGSDMTTKRARQSHRSVVENEPMKSSERIHEAAEELIEEDEPNPAFLGVYSTWREIWRVARKNRMNSHINRGEDSDDDDDDEDDNDSEDSVDGHDQDLVEHVTRTIQDMSETVRKVKRQYRILRAGKSNEGVEIQINETLSDNIEDIDAKIRSIREFDIDGKNRKVARRKGREMITDIYRRGVPDLIDLLNSAILCRSSVPPEIYDLKGVQEIVQLIDMTTELCETASKWKAKPLDTNKPIVRNIRSIVFPDLRGKIRSAFDKEIQRLLIVERKRTNRANTQARNDLLDNRADELAEMEARRRAEDLWRIEDDIKLNQKLFKARRFGLYSLDDSRGNGVSHSRNTHYPTETDHSLWTLDQEHELLKQLQKKDSRSLPATERYLRILNASLLQNKLPEHIQKKAVELKPFLLELLPNANYIHSIE